jgi:hypothetical protein
MLVNNQHHYKAEVRTRALSKEVLCRFIAFNILHTFSLISKVKFLFFNIVSFVLRRVGSLATSE